MRACGLGMGIALVASVLAASALEISEELRLSIQGDVETIEKAGPKMGEVMAALREIGASYLPEIVAPVDVDQIQTMERRRLMTGVYMADLTYASTFAQRAPAARYGQALYLLLDQIGYPHPDLERRYREALEQIDQPGGDARLEQLAKEQEQDEIWQDKLHTGEGVYLVVDGLYGSMIEGLYLTTEMCVLSNYDPASMAYVAYMRDSFQDYTKLLNRLAENPEFVMWVKNNNRLDFLASLVVILGDRPEITPAQLDSLRPAIAKARQEIVQ
jgi:hypothetical protein